MTPTVPAVWPPEQDDSIALRALVRNGWQMFGRAVGRCLDAHHLNHEAVAMTCLGHKNGKYFSKQITGEKPWTPGDVLLLPLEVQRALAIGWASHLGLICVRPIEDDLMARAMVLALANLSRIYFGNGEGGR